MNVVLNIREEMTHNKQSVDDDILAPMMALFADLNFNTQPNKTTFELKIERKYYYHLQFPKKEEPLNFEDLAVNELYFVKRKSKFDDKISKPHRQHPSIGKIL